MHLARSIAFGAFLGAAAAGCGAGTAGGIFEVRITLHTSAAVPAPVVTPPVVVAPPGAPGQLPETPPVVVAPGPQGPGQPPAQPTPPDGPVAQPSLPAAPQEPPATADTAPQIVRPQLARTSPRSICTSQSGDSAGASTVRVACSPGQFALIQPLGLSGTVARRATAWRYAFSPADPLPYSLSQVLNLRIGTGTITALRVPHLEGLLDPMEMLVSF
jgi:hypothetical protein